jgi:hypothetical protein
MYFFLNKKIPFSFHSNSSNHNNTVNQIDEYNFSFTIREHQTKWIAFGLADFNLCKANKFKFIKKDKTMFRHGFFGITNRKDILNTYNINIYNNGTGGQNHKRLYNFSDIVQDVEVHFKYYPEKYEMDIIVGDKFETLNKVMCVDVKKNYYFNNNNKRGYYKKNNNYHNNNNYNNNSNNNNNYYNNYKNYNNKSNNNSFNNNKDNNNNLINNKSNINEQNKEKNNDENEESYLVPCIVFLYDGDIVEAKFEY